MKKKLNELNRKIRHSRKKNDGLIHKRNALRKAIESAKSGTEPKRPVPEPKFIFKERELAFGGAYRSYRVEGVPKMDPEMFFRRIREGLTEAIKRELGFRNLARVETTTWIRFIKDTERIELAFNSRMMNLHRGSDLDQIVDEMFADMMTQIENRALLKGQFHSKSKLSSNERARKMQNNEPSLTSMRRMVLEISHSKVRNLSKMEVAILKVLSLIFL